ncbi:MAG: hypothetical protein KAI18_03305 [Candidatus Aenigmarchaeota archaeon]|nr:hypothetical protein [Candidatus Aenigmarchaeota archaeon]
MAGMEILIGNMNTMGFYDFLLPFVLFVAIIFGLLQKNKVFGDKETRGIDGVVAMSVSFFVINYTSIGLYFSTLFAIGATIIGAVLVGIIILGMVGIDLGGLLNGDDGKKMKLPIVAAAGVVVIILFLYASGLYEKISDYIPSIGEDTIVTIVGLLFFIVVFVMITGTGKKSPATT